MDDRRTARADLVTGAILLVLAVAVIAGAWNMDRLELRRINPLSAPGVTPGLLGVALGIASLLMVVQAARRGGLFGLSLHSGGAGARPGPATARLAGALVLSLIYALGLVGRMPFWLATTLFVASFIAVFEWQRDGRIWQRLGWAAGVGITTGLAISYVFSELFLVRLP